MDSCAALLFRRFVWEPLSLSYSEPSNTQPTLACSKADSRACVRRLNCTIRRLLVARNRFKCDHQDICMYIERSKNKNIVVYQSNLVDSTTGEPPKSGAHGVKCSFKATDPLHAYWIKIEPEHVARRRARGEPGDACELNMIERKLAYGFHATMISKDRFVGEVLPDKVARAAAPETMMEAIELLFDEVQPCVCKFVAVSSWVVWMLRLPPLKEGQDPSVSAALNPGSEGSPSLGGGAQCSTTDGGADGHALPTEDTVVAMVAMVAGELSVLQKVYVSSIEPKHFYQLPKVEYMEVFGTSIATGEPTYEKRQG